MRKYYIVLHMEGGSWKGGKSIKIYFLHPTTEVTMATALTTILADSNTTVIKTATTSAMTAIITTVTTTAMTAATSIAMAE